MRPRTDILAIFSTFMQLAGDRFDGWVSDPRLAKSMRQQLLHADDTNRAEAFWALHWYRLLQQHPRAAVHLWAYLQESCYWSATRVTRRFAMVQCSLADGFQIAIANTDRILYGYNPDYGSSLKAYARTAFGNCIRDQLRQQQDIHISSDWGLLRRLSQTQLNQALLAAGFVQPQIGSLVLMWQCFRAICIPEPGRPVRSLPAPDDTQLESIAERYNHLRQQLTPEPPVLAPTPQITVTLMQLAAAARAYLTPAVTSLNQPQYEDSVEEQLDALPTDSTPMAQLLAAEAYTQQQQRLRQIGVVLKEEIANLDAASQTLLSLYYHQALTQKDIAGQLHIRQYQVSRKLSRIRQQLLLSVVNWSQETLHISTESAVLANVSEVIHEWLQRHYSPEPPEVSE